MAIDLDFAPDAARARAIDASMLGSLGDSLAYLRQAIGGELVFDGGAISRLIEDLSAGQSVAPGVFARYYELVTAIEDGDEPEATRLLAELAAAPRIGKDCRILELASADLGDECRRYSRMMSGDSDLDIGFGPPDAEAAVRFRAGLAAGFSLLDRAAPQMAGEIRALVRELIIAGCDPTKPYEFDGGSHYQLWGALFLNGANDPNPVLVAEALAHECGHSLLFGFCVDEALVENDDDELFASPLRQDQRPMDGIYHATFVSARMHWLMARLSENAALPYADRQTAAEAAKVDRRHFEAGYGVVADHGRLTRLGRGLMARAKAYMDGGAEH